MKKYVTVTLISLIIICTACGPSPKAIATQTATAATAVAASWTATLTSTSTSTLTPTSTNTITPTLTLTPTPVPPPPIRGWKGNPVRTICLVLKGSYIGMYQQQNPDATFEAGDSDYDDIYSEVQHYLERLGLQPVSSDGACQATLTIKLSINILGSNYIGETSGQTMYCFDGAAVSGTVTLAAPEASLSFSGNKVRSGVNPDRRSGCPMWDRFTGESYFIALQGIRKMWGDQVLLFPLHGRQTDVIEYALQEIINLGPRSKQFVPELIKCLNDSECNNFWHDEVVGALKRITRQDLGEDAENWQNWWNSQKP